MIHGIIGGMQEVEQALAELRAKGWTWAAIADELGVHQETVRVWRIGRQTPANPRPVLVVLERLLQRRRIPKKRRYNKSPRTR
jgi:transcriptional regulator with XRE-family HTH domain